MVDKHAKESGDLSDNGLRLDVISDDELPAIQRNIQAMFASCEPCFNHEDIQELSKQLRYIVDSNDMEGMHSIRCGWAEHLQARRDTFESMGTVMGLLAGAGMGLSLNPLTVPESDDSWQHLRDTISHVYLFLVQLGTGLMLGWIILAVVWGFFSKLTVYDAQDHFWFIRTFPPQALDILCGVNLFITMVSLLLAFVVVNTSASTSIFVSMLTLICLIIAIWVSIWVIVGRKVNKRFKGGLASAADLYVSIDFFLEQQIGKNEKFHKKIELHNKTSGSLSKPKKQAASSSENSENQLSTNTAASLLKTSIGVSSATRTVSVLARVARESE